MIGICGASGFIGEVLHKQCLNRGAGVLGTYCSRFKPGLYKFDMRSDDFDIFDECKFVVILSAYVKIKFCQENEQEAFLLNVDKTRKLLNHLNKKEIPALFVSSNAAVKAELMETNYGKYKRIVERHIKDKNLKCDFIRPGKIDKENVEELCQKICERIWASKGRKD